MDSTELKENGETGRSQSSSLEYSEAEIVSRAFLIERYWKVLICSIFIAILFREELIRLVERWTSSGGKESHGLIIPFFSLYFLYQSRDKLKQIVGKPSFWGVIVMGLSVAGYIYSSFKGFYYPRQVMLIGMIAGVVLFLGGWRIFSVVWLPIIYLIFAMPLPSRLYYMITLPMRKLASAVAAFLLDLLPNVSCEANNVVIDGYYKSEVIRLNVAEACSGMRLLMAFLALGVAMAWLEHRPAIHRIVLLCSTIPIAIFCNMLRVLITGLLYIYMGPDYATGLLHTLLGIVMLFVAFGLYGLLTWVMQNIYVAEEEEELLVVKRRGGANG